MRDGKMAGSDLFYDTFSPIVEKNLDKFTNEEFSDIIYAYSSRGSASPELQKAFTQKVINDMSKYKTWSVLHNVAWYLIFTNNEDLQVLNSFIARFSDVPGKLPILYYRPFKIMAVLIQALGGEEVPEISENMFHFRDRFFYAEQYYNYVKYEDLYTENPLLIHFKSLLTERIGIMPSQPTCFMNLFLVHLVFEARKLGINLYFERDFVPKSDPPRLNEHAKLHKRFMKYLNYEILELPWNEYINKGNQDERDDWINEWYHKTHQEQLKKGVLDHKYPNISDPMVPILHKPQRIDTSVKRPDLKKDPEALLKIFKTQLSSHLRKTVTATAPGKGGDKKAKK